jgi:hypothetical protein
VTNNGTLWLSPQKHLTLSGSYTQSSTGKLKLTVIEPLEAVVASDGPMTLNGALEAVLTPVPLSQTAVPLLDAGKSTISGVFVSQYLQPQGQIQYATSHVTWITNKPGDVDGDGVVNSADLVALIAAWGGCPTPPANCPADMNSDGIVNSADLLLLLNHWG